MCLFTNQKANHKLNATKKGNRIDTHTHTCTTKDKTGSLYHLDNNRNSVSTITPKTMRREKIYIHINIYTDIRNGHS